MSTDTYRDEHGRRPLGTIARFEESPALAWLLRLLLIGSLFLLGVDLRAMVDARREAVVDAPVVSVPAVVRPAPRHPAEAPAASREIAPSPPADPLARRNALQLRKPIAFMPGENGVLAATGTIDAGASGRLEDALSSARRPIHTLTLDSPGGSLDDAILIARLVRAHGLDTSVESGALCASSCPLVFAGGVRRTVGPKASIGVHQFYASTDLGTDPAQAMIDAQLMTARIVKHLGQMGVDPALWFNALATPPQSLYFLTREEMKRYRLLSEPASAASGSGSEKS